MKEEIKINIQTTDENTYKVICQKCKTSTKHKVLTSVEENGEATAGDYGYWFQWTSRFEIIQCLGCETISFRYEHSNSEEETPDGDYFIDEQIFPRRSEDTWEIKTFYNVPHNLRLIYRETVDCLNNKSLTLCAAGTRALVEGVCIAYGVTAGPIEYKDKSGASKTKNSRSLAGKINGLFKAGKLTKDNSETLHELRFLGNEAIHELSSPSKEDLRLALEIIENVFNTLYEIPNKASELKYRRSIREKKE